MNFGDWTADKKVAAIAVPIRGQRNTAVACVKVVAAMLPDAKEQFVQRITAVVTLKRIAAADEIALACIFAMQCSYVTGTVLDPCAGQLVS